MAALIPLGGNVQCEGRVVGQVGDLVLDPETRRLTHLVVHTEAEDALLVPAALIDAATGDRKTVALSCSAAQLREFEQIREFAYVPLDQFPHPDETTDVGVEDVLPLPQYEAAEFGDFVGEFDSTVGLTYDRIPKGEVELRRSSSVQTADGDYLGSTAGLVVEGNEITHFLLHQGHLWWKRNLAVPVETVTGLETDTVTVSLSQGDLSSLQKASKLELSSG